ncbi:MAG: energy-coupled thiamine transporter ThiT [Erysipelotrichia bacterium]|nr:energy-coupled thiamine transporter ThiT [Erysipelotrichia bacterium]
MSNNRATIRLLSEIGMIAALGFVFDELQGILSKGIFINGGSIGFAMIAVLFMAYRRGLWPALLTGLIMGFLDIATSAFIIHPAQLLLDYIFPYAFVGLVGIFKPFFDKSKTKHYHVMWLVIGAVIGGLFKLTSHYVAGVLFWSDPTYFAWDLNSMNLYLYCFVYNVAFIGPSIVITTPLLIALYLTAPRIFTVQTTERSVIQKSANKNALVLSVCTTVIGFFSFIYFLVVYILSFTNGSGNGYVNYAFNGDYLMLFVLGLFILLLGAFSLFNTLKQNFNGLIFYGLWSAVSLTAFIYGLARLIRMYVKILDPTLYWIWSVFALVILLISSIFFFKNWLNLKREKQLHI